MRWNKKEKKKKIKINQLINRWRERSNDWVTHYYLFTFSCECTQLEHPIRFQHSACVETARSRGTRPLRRQDRSGISHRQCFSRLQAGESLITVQSVHWLKSTLRSMAVPSGRSQCGPAKLSEERAMHLSLAGTPAATEIREAEQAVVVARTAGAGWREGLQITHVKRLKQKHNASNQLKRTLLHYFLP